jgi:hypothetical protein
MVLPILADRGAFVKPKVLRNVQQKGYFSNNMEPTTYIFVLYKEK